MPSEQHSPSAFKVSSTSLSTSSQPQQYSEICDKIMSGLKSGRTYSYANCCNTIFDNRKKLLTGDDLNHTSSKTIFEVFGKRRFSNAEEFFLAISNLEWSKPDPIREVAFDRDHASTQKDIKVYSLEKRLKDLEESNKQRFDSLESRVKSLEVENKEVKAQVEKEKDHRLALTELCRKTLDKSENVCSLCKRAPLPDL
jgi:hypothetical protein